MKERNRPHPYPNLTPFAGLDDRSHARHRRPLSCTSLYIEHRPTGDLVLKSNSIGSLSSLSIVSNSDTSYTAISLGKATSSGVGNYGFRAVATDTGEPGSRDAFGLQVEDPNGGVVGATSFAPITPTAGNIRVPHQ